MRAITFLFLLAAVFAKGQGGDQRDSDDKSFENALKAVESEDRDMVYTLNDMAWEYLYINPERGFQLSRAAEDLAKRLKDSSGLAFAYGNLGALSEITGDYGKAVSYYHKSLEIYEALGKWDSYTSILSNMGILYDQVEYPDKALEYFQKAVEIDRKFENYDNLKGNFHNIGQLLKQQKNYDSALVYFNKAIELERKHGNEADIPYYYGSLGDLYAEMGQMDTAEVLLRSCLKHSESTGDFSTIGYDYTFLANYFRLIQNVDSASKYCELAYERSMATQNFDLLLTVLSIRLEVERLAQDYESAVKTGARYMTMRDSFFNLKKSFQITVLETEYQLEKKEQEVATLAVQNRAKGKYLLLISILGSLIIITTSAFFLQNRSKNRKLQERNARIEQSLEEIQVLARESHHRIKNNLQVVSSLIKLQAKHVSNDTARQTLNEAFNRIRTISLIHQKLYKAESFTTVNLQDFLHQLANQLRQSFGYEEDLIIEVHGGDVGLQVDTAIYVGLIVNELVTNSIKYGLSEKGDKSRIILSVHKHDDGLELVVADNGPGFENPDELVSKDTFGYKVMNSLLRPFKGKIILSNDNGARVTVIFNRIEYYERPTENHNS